MNKQCLYCGKEIKRKPLGREPKFCDNGGKCKRMYYYYKGKKNEQRNEIDN